MSVQSFNVAGGVGAQTLAAFRGAARVAVSTLAVPFKMIARRARINRAARQLEMLDDRTLLDIGLRRTQILSTATQVVDWPHVDPRRLAR